nr:unnamed protein product [Callosobruchus chinensis]
MAIEDSVQKALPVKDIYAWILDHFPYFKNAPTGWKNSVRHNLSLNKCFQKVEKAPVRKALLIKCLNNCLGKFKSQWTYIVISTNKFVYYGTIFDASTRLTTI